MSANPAINAIPLAILLYLGFSFLQKILLFDIDLDSIVVACSGPHQK